jgi:hypothetical protein
VFSSSARIRRLGREHFEPDRLLDINKTFAFFVVAWTYSQPGSLSCIHVAGLGWRDASCKLHELCGS